MSRLCVADSTCFRLIRLRLNTSVGWIKYCCIVDSKYRNLQTPPAGELRGYRYDREPSPHYLYPYPDLLSTGYRIVYITCVLCSRRLLCSRRFVDVHLQEELKERFQNSLDTRRET
jgi:hypothetical protein